VELSAHIRRLAGGYVAQTPELNLAASGDTPDEALRRLKAAAAIRLAEEGSEMGFFTACSVEA
jgi:predicted RNase H-like HicB family nuclease